MSPSRILTSEQPRLKVVARIRGGLGNQLFCYAAARRLSLVNNAELVLDDISGFRRDEYRRRYALHHFDIRSRTATAAERLEPFERCRRAVRKWWSSRRPFETRQYVVQEKVEFEPRLLMVKPTGTLYLDGLWQSERYFKDVEHVIRRDLHIRPPADELNRRVAQQIQGSNAVAIHVRWFDIDGATSSYNLAAEYYERAIALIESKIASPTYFIFSDDPEAARARLVSTDRRAVFISHNKGEMNAYADLWLMSLCRHFITANSTFSWWGSWLVPNEDKIIITPRVQTVGLTAWGFDGLIPDNWISL